MADKYLNYTGLQYYHNRIKNEFADKDDFDALAGDVAALEALNPQENVIEVVQKNGTALPVSNKTVNVTVPVAVSELTNDGDGESPYATQDYVDDNGGKIDIIKVNNTALPISDKTVNIDLTDYALDSDIPTKVSDLTNDSGFVTQAVNNLTNYYTKSETYTQAEIDNLIGQLEHVTLEVVQQLPTQDISTHTIYLLQVSQSPVAYDEYIYIAGDPTGHWEIIGSTNIDLTSYWTMTSGQSNSLIAITTAEIDTIVGA